jgi:dTDP-glucose 4,6-dehydratase
MEINNKNVLVTGASGFIGSHLTEALIRRGCHVHALVPYNETNSWGWLDTLDPPTRSALQVSTIDIRDAQGVRGAMENCEVVFHLAALISVQYSYQAPSSYVDVNLNGTLNVLQAARDLQVKKVVHTSSSEVYGTALYAPINEDHPLQAQSPYAATKIAADQLALSFYRSFDTPVSIIRPFNTYGPRQSMRAVIPTIITQLAHQDKIKLGTIDATRDFNYVADIVSGFIRMAESENSIGQVINIGSGFDISIREVVRLIADLMGKSVEIVSDSQRIRPEKSEVHRLCAANDKALELLNWRPRYHGIEGLKNGLSTTIEWFRKSAPQDQTRENSYLV